MAIAWCVAGNFPGIASSHARNLYLDGELRAPVILVYPTLGDIFVLTTGGCQSTGLRNLLLYRPDEVEPPYFLRTEGNSAEALADAKSQQALAMAAMREELVRAVKTEFELR